MDEAWNGVLGIKNEGDDKGKVSVDDMAFAITCGARYPTLANRGLSPIGTTIAPPTVSAGLAVTAYYDADLTNSFTSVKTASHEAATQACARLQRNRSNCVVLSPDAQS